MGFVFYDTETTGTSTSFDQILQFAAIRTDADLNEVDRLEVRCRLRSHVVAHPMALRVTGMTIGRVTDPSLPTHYEMMRAVRARLIDWSPAIFVGYNSMSFDEHLLRQALFATLHPPYLTNTDGNGRADALSLVQVAAALAPGCVSVPIGDSGRPSYKLDRIAPANGFAHANAHDALADVEATLHMAKLVHDRAPECWRRFVRFSSKATVERLLASEGAFLVTQIYHNRAYHYPVAKIAPDPDNPSAILCLHLAIDPDHLARLTDEELAAQLRGSPRPVRRVKVNAAPLIARLGEAPTGLLHPHAIDTLIDRGRRLRADRRLRDRIVAATIAGREPSQDVVHVEERLYSGFPPASDQRRMARFHELGWRSRAALVETLEDARLRHHGRLLVHEHAPEALDPGFRSEVETFVATRLGGSPADGSAWTCLPRALSAAEAMIVEHGADEMLVGYRDHVLARLDELAGSRNIPPARS